MRNKWQTMLSIVYYSLIITSFGAISPKFKNIGTEKIQLLPLDSHSDSLSFNAFDREFDLSLKRYPRTLISPKAQNLSKDYANCQFYDGFDSNDIHSVLTMSYCKNRGFVGSLSFKHDKQILHIKPTENGLYQHQISIHEIDDDDDEAMHMIEPELLQNIESKKRRLITQGMCNDTLLNDECHFIEMMIVNDPKRTDIFKNKYPNNNEWKTKLNQNVFDIIYNVQKIYQETKWRKDDEEFMCFNIVIGAIYSFENNNWSVDGNNYTPSQKTSGVYLSQYDEIKILDTFATMVQNEFGAQNNDGDYDVFALIVHEYFGHGGLGSKRFKWDWDGQYHNGVCSDRAVSWSSSFAHWTVNSATGELLNNYQDSQLPPDSIGRVLAHELGHNLGFQHDQQCAEGDFGHIMGYKKGISIFSQCTINQAYTFQSDGSYSCLLNSARKYSCNQIEDYNGECGNDIVEAFEECDDKNGCCVDCKRIRGCCGNQNESFECVKVENHGVDYNKHDDGYYGGCVQQNDVSPIYIRDDGFNTKQKLSTLSTITVPPKLIMIGDVTASGSIETPSG